MWRLKLIDVEVKIEDEHKNAEVKIDVEVKIDAEVKIKHLCKAKNDVEL